MTELKNYGIQSFQKKLQAFAHTASEPKYELFLKKIVIVLLPFCTGKWHTRKLLCQKNGKSLLM